MSKQEEIKQALAAATPGMWNKEGNEIWRRGLGYGGYEPHIHICDVANQDNAHLIAKAPEYIAYLLEETDRLRKELEEARKIRLPRQADSEGGWTIDYDFLDKLETRAYKGSDYSMDLEDLETVLLALEKVLGQEGEGNQ
ncbi:hypothetical protein [Paenibacillus xylanexedens]|uniref:hypothetical protein n=1 Tax=Paenibacillus xylanexedens TaxID=528191 RepID=UPI0011A9DBA4|nr:hypothetical protein [Paenibacillus xylanexedens]